MDMVIANWRISVHRARRTQGWGAAPRAAQQGRVERIAHRAKCMREYQRRREQVQDWFVLHGGL
ncbi:MAG TPA: hypothetical protein VFM49_08565 [Chloroflexia bacterium]|jgi:LPS sulfotransferase NodH|nr:hypothetical protein [Chloroflexia bacterium]